MDYRIEKFDQLDMKYVEGEISKRGKYNHYGFYGIQIVAC